MFGGYAAQEPAPSGPGPPDLPVQGPAVFVPIPSAPVPAFLPASGVSGVVGPRPGTGRVRFGPGRRVSWRTGGRAPGWRRFLVMTLFMDPRSLKPPVYRAVTSLLALFYEAGGP